MSKFHDDRTAASDRISITLSAKKMQRLQPSLFGPTASSLRIRWGQRELDAEGTYAMLAEHMSFGDSRAALLVCENPFLVAAYTDEQDAVLILRFPQTMLEAYAFRKGDRLLTVNTYGRGEKLVPDIFEGVHSTKRWTNCYPIIADFVSDDAEQIDRRKRAITEREWDRAAQLSAELMSADGFSVRDGRPLRSRTPGKPMID